MPPAPRRQRITRSRVEVSPLREVLAANLIAARTACKMTQWGLARATGISQNYISRVENAETNASLDLIDALAQHLGRSAASLISPSRRESE